MTNRLLVILAWIAIPIGLVILFGAAWNYSKQIDNTKELIAAAEARQHAQAEFRSDGFLIKRQPTGDLKVMPEDDHLDRLAKRGDRIGGLLGVPVAIGTGLLFFAALLLQHVQLRQHATEIDGLRKAAEDQAKATEVVLDKLADSNLIQEKTAVIDRVRRAGKDYQRAVRRCDQWKGKKGKHCVVNETELNQYIALYDRALQIRRVIKATLKNPDLKRKQRAQFRAETQIDHIKPIVKPKGLHNKAAGAAYAVLESSIANSHAKVPALNI